MNVIFLIAAFAFFATSFIYGLLAWFVSQRNAKTESDWVFLLSMLVLAFWCLSNAIVSAFGSVLEKPTSPFTWLLLQTSYPLLYTIPPAIRHCMVLSRLSLTGWEKWLRLAVNYLGMTPVIIHLYGSARPLPEHYGPAFSLPLYFYFLLILLEIRFRAKPRAHYAQKPATRFILQLGMGSALLMVAVPSFFCRLYPAREDLIALIPKLAVLPPALAIAYGVFRYHFMDVVLTRGLLYSSLGALFIGLYLLAIQYGGQWLLLADKAHPIAFAGCILFLLLLFHFLFHVARDGLQKAIDRSVFRHRLKSAEMLRSFSQTLTEWSDLGGLCRSFTERVTDSLRLSFGAILFVDGVIYRTDACSQPAPWQREKISRFTHLLSQNVHRPAVVEELSEGPLNAVCGESSVGLLLPLPCREQQGWLLLGEKRSGRPFLSQEIALLEAVCGQLAVAIDNILLIEAKVKLEREMQHREKLAAIGQLAATVAHDIRNPITGAKCLLQQVEEEWNGASQGKEYVRLALEDLDRVERSVSQLLTFARKEEFSFSKHDLTELTETTIRRFLAQMEGKHVNIKLRANAPTWAMVDEEKIRRMLINLLTNAADAVNGDGLVQVDVGASEPEVEIRVSDNGHGLTPEAQAQIFEPFFTTKEKGTGLGLAIAKKIVDGHGGRIAVASIRGQGTTFTVTFPRQRPSEKVAA
jgi:signal transduction histidine kinase